jgi:hypothetical protein
MAKARLLGHSGTPEVQTARPTGRSAVTDAVREYARLTNRDRELIALLAQHRVFTTDQLHRLAFDNLTTAQHRAVTLARRGVLARFRHYQRPGSQAWRYTLGVLGAIIDASRRDVTPPAPSRTTSQVLSLASSPRLNHLLAVNDFFVDLTHHARTHPGRQLTQWWPERVITDACHAIARPDGYGEWTEHHPTRDTRREPDGHGAAGRTGPGSGVTVGFFLELDRGTEPLPRLVDKLTGYRQLADAGITRPVLIVVPTATRETHLHAHPVIRDTGPGGPPVVATASTNSMSAAGLTPADAVWLRPGERHRVRLVNLAPVTIPGTAGPSPDAQPVSSWPRTAASYSGWEGAP